MLFILGKPRGVNGYSIMSICFDPQEGSIVQCLEMAGLSVAADDDDDHDDDDVSV